MKLFQYKYFFPKYSFNNFGDHIHCLGKKKIAHSNILLDRLLLWLRSTFAVALFRQTYAMLQHLFPSRVAFIFGWDFVLMTGESNHSFNGVKVRTLWWPIHVWKWLLILPDTHVLMLHLMNLGIVVLEYAQAIREEKIHWWDNLVIQYIQELCWLATPRPDQP